MRSSAGSSSPLTCLPADLTGTLIYSQKKEEFNVRKGPIFANFILADEINRSPAKVQSALLEAMQERQVTIGDHTYPLEEPFLVMATQNPIEQEGTYPLPEAQVDRFMLKVVIGYPDKEEEKKILRQNIAKTIARDTSTIIKTEDIIKARDVVREVYLDEKIENYITDIVFASRYPGGIQTVEVRAAHPVWRLAACQHQPGPCRQGLCLHQAARIRDPGRYQGSGPRRDPPPHRAHLRSRS